MENKIFLGGTCNNSTWREQLIPNLQINYFNPVVKNWTKECQKIEEYEKDNNCNIHLYVITKEMLGAFSIAEAVNSSHTKNKITYFQVISTGFSKSELKSFQAICDLLKRNNAVAFISNELNTLIELLKLHK